MKFKFSIFISLMLICLVLISVGFVYLVDISDSPRLVSQATKQGCKTFDSTPAIDVSQPLNIAVWNVYKLQKGNWQSEIKKLQSKNTIMLLQEAVDSKTLLNLFQPQGWSAEQAYAFSFSNQIAGVMTVSKPSPEQVCAFNQAEPLLPFPKTALLSMYRLSNQQQLAVVNIHSVNFTLDLDVFKGQISNILDYMQNFDGPIIFAGDFNTWDQRRLALLKNEFAQFDLQQVKFSPDERLTVFNAPLDHIFYRGFTLKEARSQSTSASDHAWLEASFTFN